MSAMTTISTWEDKYFEMLKKVETPMLDVVGKIAERLSTYVRQRPGFMTEMPTAHDWLDHGLKLRKRVIDEQAAFARKMMKAMDPVVAKFDHQPVAAKVRKAA